MSTKSVLLALVKMIFARPPLIRAITQIKHVAQPCPYSLIENLLYKILIYNYCNINGAESKIDERFIGAFVVVRF